MKLGSCFHHKHTSPGFILKNVLTAFAAKSSLKKNEIPAAGKGVVLCCLFVFLLLPVNEPASELCNQTQPGGFAGLWTADVQRTGRRCAGRARTIRCVGPQRPRPLPLARVAERKTGGGRNTQWDDSTLIIYIFFYFIFRIASASAAHCATGSAGNDGVIIIGKKCARGTQHSWCQTMRIWC